MTDTTNEQDDASGIERMSLRLSKDASRLLKASASKKGLSVNEFMRRALGTEIYLLDQIESGATVVIERPGKPPMELVLR